MRDRIFFCERYLNFSKPALTHTCRRLQDDAARFHRVEPVAPSRGTSASGGGTRSLPQHFCIVWCQSLPPAALLHQHLPSPGSCHHAASSCAILSFSSNFLINFLRLYHENTVPVPPLESSLAVKLKKLEQSKSTTEAVAEKGRQTV
jgi:hypothetical protein